MAGLVFVESSCLVDTWSMAKELVRSRTTQEARLRELDAEAARGTDLRAVHLALWGLLAGHEFPERTALGSARCIDRVDALGCTAARVVRAHRRAGDTIVVVSDLVPVFAEPLREHLGVDRVVCGAPVVGTDGRLSGEFPGILLGAAAARAAELVARQESIPPARCVAYGRDPRDRELLRAVGHGVRIDYGGRLDPPLRLRSEAPVRPRPRQDPLGGVLAELPAV